MYHLFKYSENNLFYSNDAGYILINREIVSITMRKDKRKVSSSKKIRIFYSHFIQERDE
jgi:hypothetical protein